MTATEAFHDAACRALRAAGERPTVRAVASYIGQSANYYGRCLRRDASPAFAKVEGWVRAWNEHDKGRIVLTVTHEGVTAEVTL